MKIKGQSKFLSISALFPIFLICTVVSIVLRSIQVYSLIDASTGFYSSSSLITVIFYALIFGSCLMFFVYSYFSQQSLEIEVFGVKSKPLAAITSVYAVIMAYYSVTALLTSINDMDIPVEYNPNAMVMMMYKFKVLMSNGTIPMFIQSIFGIISVIYFIFMASSFIKGNDKAGNRKIMALAPVGWISFRMIYLFVSKISFVRVSDLFLELMMLACMALFFMAFAQVASGVYSDGTAWRLSAFGLSASVIASCLEVSRLIFTIVDKETYINENHPFNVMDLVFCVFAAVLVFTLCKQPNQAPAVENTNIRKPDSQVG